MLRLEDVILSRAGQRVLDRATLVVNNGEIVVLCGPRGAGKTSLLAVAAGTLLPQAGAVWMGKRNILTLQTVSLPYLRRNVGYLPPAAPFVPHESVLENVALAVAARGAGVAEAEAAGRRALASLDLQDLADRTAHTLSPPERQLVACARALAGPPPLVILDEPSAGLDARDRERLLAALGDLRSTGAAVLCASSDAALVLGLVERGAREIRLEGGRVVGGTPALAVVNGPAGLRAVPGPEEAPAAQQESRDADLTAGGRGVRRVR